MGRQPQSRRPASSLAHQLVFSAQLPPTLSSPPRAVQHYGRALTRLRHVARHQPQPARLLPAVRDCHQHAVRLADVTRQAGHAGVCVCVCVYVYVCHMPLVMPLCVSRGSATCHSSCYLPDGLVQHQLWLTHVVVPPFESRSPSCRRYFSPRRPPTRRWRWIPPTPSPPACTRCRSCPCASQLRASRSQPASPPELGLARRLSLAIAECRRKRRLSRWHAVL
jgi:hypothetical protein